MTVNIIYNDVNMADNKNMSVALELQIPLTVIRRANTLSLYHAFLEQAVAAGGPAKGQEAAFAAALQISASLWSQIKSSRPIGDKLARQIESARGVPAGWLDEEHETSPQSSQAEDRFLEMASQAWRASNAAGKRALTRLVRDHLGDLSQVRDK